MKRTFETEADIRNFKSKIFLLPRKLQLEIQQMADDGKKEWAIENHIKANYKGSISVPTPPTIGTWLDWYEAKKKLAVATGQTIEPNRTQLAIIEKTELIDVEKERQSILDSSTDISNKKELLERLIKKCIQRMKHIESLQELEGVTASLEAVVGHYLREIHSLVQTELKLSGELADESNQRIAELVNQNLYQLIQIFFSVVMATCPDKVEEIKSKFYQELRNKQELAEAFKDSI